MPKKSFLVDGDLSVVIYKRRNSRNLRLTIAAGEVRVSIPTWATYQTGLKFAIKRQAWIRSQIKQKPLLLEAQPIGKAHRLHFIAKPAADKISTRMVGGEIRIYLPGNMRPTDALAQAAAQKAGIKALRQESEKLLPQQLASLAEKHHFAYKSVKIKQLKGRWGSCDQSQNIVLNLYLMQLPWELIDYVLVHELTHTQILQHGPVFWEAMAAKLPNVKQLRKNIKAYSPILSA